MYIVCSKFSYYMAYQSLIVYRLQIHIHQVEMTHCEIEHSKKSDKNHSDLAVIMHMNDLVSRPYGVGFIT